MGDIGDRVIRGGMCWGLNRKGQKLTQRYKYGLFYWLSGPGTLDIKDAFIETRVAVHVGGFRFLVCAQLLFILLFPILSLSALWNFTAITVRTQRN